MGIRINAARQADRVRLRETSRARIVVAIEVIRELGFPIRILSREAEVEDEATPRGAGIVLDRTVAEGFAGGQVSPNQLIALVGDQSWRGQMIGMDEIQARLRGSDRDSNRCAGRLRPAASVATAVIR